MEAFGAYPPPLAGHHPAWIALTPSAPANVSGWLCSDKEGLGPISQLYDFTPCFIDGVVVSVLAAFMLVFGSAKYLSLRRLRGVHYPYATNGVYPVKLGLLGVYALVNLLVAATTSTPLPRVAYTLALVPALLVHLVQHTKTYVSCGVLLFFYAGSVVTGLLRIFGLVLRRSTHSDYLVWGLLTLVAAALLALELVPKRVIAGNAKFQRQLRALSPYDTANVFSRINFEWMTPLMRKGHEQYLTQALLPPLPLELRSREASNALTANYYDANHQPKTLLAWALVKLFGARFMVGGFFKGLQDILAFVQPQLLRLLIKFVNTFNEDEHQPLARGFAISLAMFAVGVIQTACLHQYFQRLFDTGMSVKSALTLTVYRKLLTLSAESRGTKNTGDIVNLMLVDTQRLQDLCQNLLVAWSGPFQIVLCLVLLHGVLGNAMWAGVAIMVVMIPLNGVIARIQRRLQKAQMKNKDERLRLVLEILNNIKSLKLYGWEHPYAQKLAHVRNDKELANLKRMGVFLAVLNFTWNVAPFLVSCSTFALFVWMKPDTPLSTDMVFPALSLFNLLSFPLAVVPMVITSVVEATVALSRLSEFLSLPELQDDAVVRHKHKRERAGEVSVRLVDATFSWKKPPTRPALSNISLQFLKGQLSCVVGKVGAGKSLLLTSLLGDLYRQLGRVETWGSVAYCPQVAWIMNGTVKENILFGHVYDPAFYHEVIKACALQADMKIFADGDETQVGEKGISLSGGQKARLALARAVYARADIYILDDVLLAVDEHVGRHLITHVLGPTGLLAHKCRVLATNLMLVLAIADCITMLKAGEIVQTGTYGQVVADPLSPLAQLLLEFGKSKDKSTSATPLEIESEVASLAGSLQEAALEETDDEVEEEDPAAVPSARDEHSEQGSVKWDVYLAYARACNPLGVALFLAFILLSMLALVAGNVWLKHWLEVNTEVGYNPDVPFYLGVYFLLGLGSALLMLLQTVILWIFCTIQGSMKLHAMMALAVLRAPMQFFETTPIGRVLNRFSNDIYKIDEILGRVFLMFFSNSAKVLMTVLVICFSTWQFVFMVVPIGFLYSYYQRYYLMTSRELRRLDSVLRSPIYANFLETLNGVSLIRAYGQTQRFLRINEKLIDKNMQAYNPLINSNRWLAVRLEFLGSLIILAAAGLSIVNLPSGTLSAGMVGLSVLYALSVTQLLNWIVRMTVEVETNIVSVERILEYSELTPEAPEVVEDRRPPPHWPSSGQINFVDYSTKYRPELEPVLKDITLSINPSEKIGIVGRTGAGKLSLTMALFRIIEPSGGYITIDSVNSLKIGLLDLRPRLSIIPQDAQLFEGTIRDNLDPVGVYSDEQLTRALRLSHLEAHVKSMASDTDVADLDVQLSEGGTNLSVGQRQLMCLARALLNELKVLVLDEATAAVDVETDKVLQETIREEFKDRTILTIAHRLNTIIDSDRILVLEHGEVKEFAPPAELLKNKESLFYSLALEGGLVEE